MNDSTLKAAKVKQQGTALNDWRACPGCGADNYQVIETLTDLQFFVDREDGQQRVSYSQVYCRQCSLLYMNPCYNDKGFELLFALAGRSYGDGGSRHGEQLAWLDANNCLRADATYMDIGCFEGDFLISIANYFADSQPRLIGIDFDQPAIAIAQQKTADLNARFLQGKFEGFSLDETVDVYTLFHVLEHLPDPVAVLERLALYAHKTTALIIEVPILEQGITNDIHGFYSPQHLTHFSKATLHNMLAATGWEIRASQAAQGYNGFRIYAARAGQTITANRYLSVAEDIQAIYKERSHHYQSLAALNKVISAIPPFETVIIWGAGMHLEYLFQRSRLFQQLEGCNISLVDADPLKQGHTWRGLAINAPETVLDKADLLSVGLVISSYGGQPNIAEAAMAMGVAQANIIRLYEYVNAY